MAKTQTLKAQTRKRTGSGVLKQMRREAQELDEKEETLAEQLSELNDPKQTAGLRGDDRGDELQEQLEKNKSGFRKIPEPKKQKVLMEGSMESQIKESTIPIHTLHGDTSYWFFD